MLFNKLQDIELLNFSVPVKTSVLCEEMETLLLLSIRSVKEGEYVFDQRVLVLECEDFVLATGHYKKDLN